MHIVCCLEVSEVRSWSDKRILHGFSVSTRINYVESAKIEALIYIINLAKTDQWKGHKFKIFSSSKKAIIRIQNPNRLWTSKDFRKWSTHYLDLMIFEFSPKDFNSEAYGLAQQGLINTKFSGPTQAVVSLFIKMQPLYLV